MTAIFSKRRVISVVILGLLAFAFFSLYLEGIPYEQETAAVEWAKASETSWGTLAGYLFSPLTFSRMAQDEYLMKVRVTEHLLLKGWHALFGESLQGIRIYNSLLAAFLAMILYVFALRVTSSGLASAFVTVFLLVTPAYGWSVLEFGDFSPLDHILLLAYLLYLMVLVDGLDSGGKVSIWAWPLLWVLGMATIRAKDPNLFLVPGLSWWLVLIRRRISLGLTFVLVLLTVPLIWVREASPLPPLQKALQYPIQLLFSNPYGYSGENTCCLATVKNTFPSSIFCNFGFFLGWLFILGLPLIWVIRRSVSTGLFLTGWTLMSLGLYAGTGLLTFTRHATWALLPFTLTAVFLFSNLVRAAPGRIRKALAIMLLILAGVKTAENLGHSLYVHKGLERIWGPKWIFREEIYKAETGKAQGQYFPLIRFWYPPSDFLRAIAPYIIHHVTREVALAKDLEFYGILSRWGHAYVASDKPLALPWQTDMVMKVETSALSTMTRILAGFSKKKYPVYYLYRVNL